MFLGGTIVIGGQVQTASSLGISTPAVSGGNMYNSIGIAQGISSLGTAASGAVNTIMGVYMASVNAEIQKGDYETQSYQMGVQSEIAASDIDTREQALSDVEAIANRRMEQKERLAEVEGEARVAAATVAEQNRTSEETKVDMRSLYFFGDAYA